MAWAYEILETRNNPVPYDVRYITVKFYNEGISFTKTLKFISENFPTEQSIANFLLARCAKLDDFDIDIVAANTNPVNTITNAQFRIWLIRRGSFTAANNQLTALGVTNELFQMWQNNNVFTRTSPLILAIANQLNLTNDQINTMFSAASQIEV